MNKISATATATLMFMALFGMAAYAATTTVDSRGQIIADCGGDFDMIEVRLLNQTGQPITVTGEIWAQADGSDQAVLISAVPPEYQQVEAGNWGGPVTRVEDHLADFQGKVWGEAKMFLGGNLAGKVTLEPAGLNCVNPKPATSFQTQTMVGCDLTKIRMQNQMTETVKITGEIWAQADGSDQAVLISAVPPEYQQVEAGNWGGPEEIIGSILPQFAGVVWGKTEMFGQDGLIVGSSELPKTQLSCDPPANFMYYLPAVFN